MVQAIKTVEEVAIRIANAKVCKPTRCSPSASAQEARRESVDRAGRVPEAMVIRAVFRDDSEVFKAAAGRQAGARGAATAVAQEEATEMQEPLVPEDHVEPAVRRAGRVPVVMEQETVS